MCDITIVFLIRKKGSAPEFAVYPLKSVGMAPVGPTTGVEVRATGCADREETASRRLTAIARAISGKCERLGDGMISDSFLDGPASRRRGGRLRAGLTSAGDQYTAMCLHWS